jgi:hypothetical protein
MSVVDGNEWERLKRFNLAEIYQPTLKSDTKAEATAIPEEVKTDEIKTDEAKSQHKEAREAETSQAS